MSGRIYLVYSPHPLSPYVTREPPGRGWREDRRSWWRFRVRAHTVAQAKHLAAHRIYAREGGPGIVRTRTPEEVAA